MIQRAYPRFLVALAVLASVACGGSDDSSGNAAGSAGSSGTSGTAGSSGSGGAAGTSGSSGSSGSGGSSGSAGSAGTAGSGGTAGSAGTAGSGGGGAAGTGGGGSAGTSGTAGSGGTAGMGGMPAGWLYTTAGDTKVHVSNGATGDVWMGRGVNADDLFLCGYNYGLWMDNPNGEQALTAVVEALIQSWKTNFFRVSLSMDSYDPPVGWTTDGVYKTAMTNVIHAIGAHPNTYVMVTVRSDATMTDANGNACGPSDDAVCIPTSGTDDVYRALVTSFKDAPYVLFGVSNEPGGNGASDQTIRDHMDHVVGVIRAQEDLLGVPHHLVSVQGNQWTSDIGFYNTNPLAHDNVVYEYHSYPPSAGGYTQSNIPVIVGEYGPLGSDTSFAASFYADVEAKQIPNLAWTAAPYSPCNPDLLQVTNDATLTVTPWGQIVKDYLTSH